MKRTSALTVITLIGSSLACGDLTGPEIHTFHVSGTVRNAVTSQAMASVKVVAYQPQTEGFLFVIPSRTYTSALTDASGRYSLDFGVKLCVGFFVVSAEAPSADAVPVEMDGCTASRKDVVVNLFAGK